MVKGNLLRIGEKLIRAKSYGFATYCTVVVIRWHSLEAGNAPLGCTSSFFVKLSGLSQDDGNPL